MTTNLIPQDLFAITTYPGYITVARGTASPQQLAALGTLLEQSSRLFSFFEIRHPGGSWPETLRVRGPKSRELPSFVANLEVESLEVEVERLVHGKRQFELQVEAEEAFEAQVERKSLFEFAAMFCERTNGKLKVKLYQPDFVVTAAELLPVTHFKALARVTTYNGAKREFSAKSLDKFDRLKLLKIADKIGKSTKKVTKEDILARRERIRAKKSADTGPLDMDFWEASEDFGKAQALVWMRQGRLTEPASDIWKYL